MTRIKFSRVYPLPAYDGPQPVYRATFPWVGAVDCYVRRNGQVWETAPAHLLECAWFTPCPVADASATRYGAAMAFNYYYNREVMAGKSND